MPIPMYYDPTGQTDSGTTPDPNDPQNDPRKSNPSIWSRLGQGLQQFSGPGGMAHGSLLGAGLAGLAGIGSGMASGNPQSAAQAQAYGQAGSALGGGMRKYMNRNQAPSQAPAPGSAPMLPMDRPPVAPVAPGAPAPPIPGITDPALQPPNYYDPNAQDDTAEPAARGGIFTRPTKVLLGERGPEAVVPLRGGTSGIVSPAAMLPGMGTIPRQPRYEGSHPGEIRTPAPIAPGGRVGNGPLPGPGTPGPRLPHPPKFSNYKRV